MGIIGGLEGRREGHRRYPLWLLLAGLLGLLGLALALSAPASAAGSGNWPPPASGDWWVTTATAVSNETVQVNGTLYVYLTSLTMDNVTLLINSNSVGSAGIYVYAGSSLVINNSVVKTVSPTGRFWFTNNGAASIERNDISRLAAYGLLSYSSNFLVRNNTIHEGSYSGVTTWLATSGPTVYIEGNTLYAIDYYAMLLYLYSAVGASYGPHVLNGDFVLRNNTVRDNIGGGVYILRYLYDTLNTYSSMRSNVTIQDNQFLRNRGYALYVYNDMQNSQGSVGAFVNASGSMTITGNRIEENAAYYAVYLRTAIYASFSGGAFVRSDIDFSRNTVVNNSGAGVYIDFVNQADHSSAGDVTNDGLMLFRDNIITNNSGFGIRVYRFAYAWLARNASVNGGISILDNQINNNADTGIYAYNYAYSVDSYSALLDGPVRIENNSLLSNSGQGIYTYNYAYKYQGNQNGTAEIRGPLTIRNNEVAHNLAGPAVYVTRVSNSDTGSTAYIGGDIDLSNNHVHNNSGNGVGIDFLAQKNLGKTTGFAAIDSNLTMEGNWVANNSLYIGVSIERDAITYYSSSSRMTGWTRIRNNLIEGHDVNGLMMQQRALNYYGSSAAESVLSGDVLFEGNTLRHNNAAAAYLYFYAYSFYSTSSRVESNLSIINNNITDNQNVGLYTYFYALATTALSGDTSCNVPTVIRGNDFSRNKGPGLQLYRIATSDRTSANHAYLGGNLTVESNTADSNLGEGLYLYNAVSNTQGDQGAAASMWGPWTVRNNVLTNNLGFLGGIALFGSVSAYETEAASMSIPLEFYSNTIRGNSGYGAYVSLSGSQYYFRSATERGAFNQTGDVAVRNNILDSNARTGLFLGFSVDAVNVNSDMRPSVSNNSISGNSGPYGAQLSLWDVAGPIDVRDNDLSANQGSGIFLLQNEGRASSFTFYRNLMRQNKMTGFGVYADFANARIALTVENNNASGNDVLGPVFAFTNGGNTVVRFNQVRGSVNATAAFQLDTSAFSSQVTFANNTIDGNSGAGLLAVTEGTFSVADNIASNNTRDGIAVQTLGDWITSTAIINIVRNHANQNGGNGFFAYATWRLTFTDNEARGNGLAGLRVNFLAVDPVVARNTFALNRYGVALSGNGTSSLTSAHPVRNLTIMDSLVAGLVVEDAAVALYNSTITSISGVDLSVRQGRIDGYGAAVGYASGEVRASGEIHIWWNLSFRVLWQNGVPVPGALILMNGSTGESYGTKLANASGLVGWFRAEEWGMVDAQTFLWSPYTFTGQKNGEEGSNTTQLNRDKEVWIFINDIHPPAIRVDFPSEGALYNRSTVPFAGNVTDVGSGMAGLDVGLDVGLYASLSFTPSGAFSGSFTLTDGGHMLRLRAADIAGRETVVTVNFTVDTTPPILTVLEPTGALTNQTLLRIRIQTSPDAVLASIGYDDLSVHANSTFDAVVRLFEGPNLFRIRAVDRAGNSNETFVAITLDTIPPLVTITEPEDGTITNAPVLKVAGTTEAGARVRLGGQNVTPTAGGGFEGAVQLSDGNNTVEVAAQDAAGNWGYARVRAVLDLLPPWLRVTSPANGLVTSQDFITVEGEAEEGSTIFVDGKGISALGVFRESVHLEEGSNTIVIMAKDEAGNSVRVERIVIKDTTVPFIDILDPLGGHGFSNEATYAIVGRTEPGATVKAAEVRTTADSDGDFALPVNLSQGETVVLIEVTDVIGNRNSTAVTLTLDTVPPSLILYAPANMTRYQVGTAEILGATEFGAHLTIDGQDVQAAVDGSFRWLVTLETGVNNITIRSTDKAGNSEEVVLVLYLGGTQGGPPPTPGTNPGGSNGNVQVAGGGADLTLFFVVIAAGVVAGVLLRSHLRRGRGPEDSGP